MNEHEAYPSAGFQAALMLATQPRRAALMMRAMTPADRDWILAALPPDQRGRLLGLLDDFDHGGRIEPDCRPADSSPARPPAATGEHQTALAWLERIDSSQVKRLAALLAQEPPGLVACLLCCHAWPWEKEMLSCLPQATRIEIERRRRHPAAGTGLLRRTVLRQVCRALDAPAFFDRDTGANPDWNFARGQDRPWREGPDRGTDRDPHQGRQQTSDANTKPESTDGRDIHRGGHGEMNVASKARLWWQDTRLASMLRALKAKS